VVLFHLFSSSVSTMASLKRKQKELEEATAAQSVKINARSTRGKRQGELAGEDAEADQEFWGQDAWNEDDSDYSSEAEEKDVFDSDFNESESSGDEEGGDATEKELRKAERQDKAKEAAAGGGVYKEPVKRKVGRPPGPRKPAVVAAPAPAASADADCAGAAEGEGAVEGATQQTAADAALAQAAAAAESAMAASRSMRASTKNKTEVSIKVRQHEAKVAAQTKRVVAPEEKVKTDFTQEELLLEATETEHINANWVAKQRQLAEENKVLAYTAQTVA
jgi:YL1 nuclear protein